MNKENRQFPRTEAYLERMEEIMARCYPSYEEYEAAPDDEKYILSSPMLHLAEAICADTDYDSSGWAAILAKYILMILGLKGKDVWYEITGNR